MIANPKWVPKQKKRLGRRYESYWYSTERAKNTAFAVRWFSP